MIVYRVISGSFTPVFAQEPHIGEGSRRVRTLMGDDYISLKFSTDTYTEIKIGDGILYDGSVYVVTDPYAPSYNENTGGWDYEIRFDAQYIEWKNRKFKYNPAGSGQEASWSLTSVPSVFASVFINNLTQYNSEYPAGFKHYYVQGSSLQKEPYEFVIDGEISGLPKSLTFSNVNLIDALNQIAQTWEREWWVDGKYIHIGKCEGSQDTVDLSLYGYEDEEGETHAPNLASMQGSGGTAKYATRIHPFGSTRNLPAWYRKELLFTATKCAQASEGVVIADEHRHLRPSYFVDGYDDVVSSKVNLSIGPETFTDRQKREDGKFHLRNGSLGNPLDISGGGSFLLDVRSAVIDTYTEARTSLGIYSAADIKKLHVKFTVVFALSDSESETRSVDVELYPEPKLLPRRGELTPDRFRDGNKFVFPSDMILSIDAPSVSSRVSCSVDIWCEFLSTAAFTHIKGSISSPSTIKGSQNDIWSTPEEQQDGLIFIGSTGYDAVFNYGLKRTGEVGSSEFLITNASLSSIQSALEAHDNHFKINNDALRKYAIPTAYWSPKDASGDIVNTATTEDRLRIPEEPEEDEIPEGYIVENGYIQVDGEAVVEDIVVFEDEYPKFNENNLISDVTPIQYEDNDNGVPIPKTAYRFKISNFEFSEDYIIEGRKLSIIFAQTTDETTHVTHTPTLCGMEFEVKFNPRGVSPNDTDYQLWQIIPREYGGREFPNASVYPSDGDGIILIGWDSSASEETGMIPQAESHLLAKAFEYIKKTRIDPNTYDCTAMHDWAKEKGILPIGNKVNLRSPLFSGGVRASRVIGYEYPLDYPYDSPRYTIGESLAYSRLGEIENRIQELVTSGDTYSSSATTIIGGGGSQPSVNINVVQETGNSTEDVMSQASVTNSLMQLGASIEDVGGLRTVIEQMAAYLASGRIIERITIDDLNETHGSGQGLLGGIKDGIYSITASESNGDEIIGYLSVRRTEDERVMLVAGSLGIRTTQGVQELYVSGDATAVYLSTADSDNPSTAWSTWALLGHHDASGVSFGGNVEIENGDLTIGDFAESGENISGAKITKEGRGTFTNLKSLSLEIYELIYNRINVQEGDTSFADYGTIESITEESGGQLLIGIRERWDGDIQPFQPGDILYGYVNDLEESGIYGMCWMRVVSRENNAIHVVLYDGADTPTGANIDPNEGMLITRWGNAIEPNATSYEQYGLFITYDESTGKYYNRRQNHFYISSDDGRMMELMGVNTPILRMENYAMVSGILPEGLVDKSRPIDQNEPYFYAKGIVVEDFIRVDHRSRIVRMENYLGDWVEGEQYVSTDTYFDTVTYDGKRWQCVSASTYDEPSDSSPAWVLMGKDGEDGVAYRLTVTDSAVHAKKNAQGNWEFSASNIGASVARSKESGVELLTTNEAIGRYGLHIEYQKNDGTREVLALGDISELSVMVGGTEYILTTHDDYILETEGSKIEVDDTVNNVRLFLVNNSGEDIDEISVPILKDGENGSKGALMYQAGKWQAGTTYTATKDTWPIVLYQPAGSTGTYYYLPSNGNETRTSTGQEPSNPTYPWKQVEQFSVIFTNALFADFGKLGDWVFYGNWMFSQYGDLMGNTDDTVAARNIPYNDQDAITAIRDGGIGRKAHWFCPNWWANAETGETYMGNATVDGSLVSKKMTVTFMVQPNFNGSTPTGPFIDVDPNNGFNYIVKDRSALGGSGTPRSAGVLFLCMPDNRNNGWTQAGTQCVIVHEGSPILPPTPDNVILYAGSRSSTAAGVNDDGWFLWKGQKTKFIYIAPGMYVRLVSVIISVKGSDDEYHDHLYWLVENASDFEPFDAVIDVETNGNKRIGFATKFTSSSGGLKYHQMPILGNARYSALTMTDDYSFADYPQDVQSYATVIFTTSSGANPEVVEVNWWGDEDNIPWPSYDKVIVMSAAQKDVPNNMRPSSIGQILIIKSSSDSSKSIVYIGISTLMSAQGTSAGCWAVISDNWS